MSNTGFSSKYVRQVVKLHAYNWTYPKRSLLRTLPSNLVNSFYEPININVMRNLQPMSIFMQTKYRVTASSNISIGSSKKTYYRGEKTLKC